MRSRLPFYCECVSWPTELLAALDHLIDEGVEVERDEFAAHADVSEEEGTLLPASDWAVRYYRLDGYPVYWAVQSAIEYVYADDETIARIQELAENRLA